MALDRHANDNADGPSGRRTVAMLYRTRRTVRALLLSIPVFAVLLAAAAIAGHLAPGAFADGWLIAAAGGGAAAVALAAYGVHAIVAAHLADLERVKQDLDLAAATGVLPSRWRQFTHGPGEIASLAQVIEGAFERRRELAGEGEWLAGIMAGIPAGVIVFTDTGLVGMANAAARTRLGPLGTTPGHSIFTIVDHARLGAAVETARANQRPAPVMLRDPSGEAVEARVAPLAEGGVISFIAEAAVFSAEGTAMDLSLRRRAPAPQPFDGATALSDLPLVSLDLETTGLDTARDRILSVGAVRLQGRRVYTEAGIDLLCNPGVDIPERSFEVHGISDRLVATAPPLREIWEEIARFVDGCIIVGHQIGFDLAMLDAEARRHGLPPIRRPALDTLELYRRIAQDRPVGLESAAEALGVSVFGRHTALGDAIVTAELFNAMIERLAGEGIVDWQSADAAARPPAWRSA